MIKKIAMIAAFTFCGYTFAQSTTQEEYLYMTKGLKIQLESGLDMKKGYKLKKISRNHIDKYTFTFNLLIRDNETLAGIIVYAQSKVSGKEYIKAIPFGTKEKLSPLFTKYFDSISEWDGRMATAYSMALTNVMSKTLLKLNIKEK